MERRLDALVRARYGTAAAVPSGVRTLQNLVHYLWPQHEPALRLRVVGALACLVGAKLLSIQVPFFFKHVVDALGAAAPAAGAAGALEAAAQCASVGLLPLYAAAAYGVCVISIYLSIDRSIDRIDR